MPLKNITKIKQKYVILALWAICYAVLLSVSVVFVDFLTGEPFRRSIVGWLLIIAIPLGLFATALMVMQRNSKGKIRYVGEIAFLIWILIIGSAFPLALAHSNLDWKEAPLVILVLLSLLGLAIVFFGEILKKRFTLWKYALFMSLVAPLLLAWASRS